MIRFFKWLFAPRGHWAMYETDDKEYEWFLCSRCGYEPELVEFKPEDGEGESLLGYILEKRCPECMARLSSDMGVWLVNEDEIIDE